MKKSIIALMGLFTLIACSDEAIQDLDKQSENPNIPMSVYASDSNISYASPWSISNTSPGLSYIFENQTQLFIRITPYIGWAYEFYWVNDFFINDPGRFPNLFSGTTPYGESIEIDPIVIVPNNTDVYGPSTGSLPFEGAVTGPLTLLHNPNTIDPNEIGTMSEIGKIYYIKYEVFLTDEDLYYNKPSHSGMIKQKVGDDHADYLDPSFSSWVPLNSLNGFPNIMLMYHNIEKEICLFGVPGIPPMLSEETFNIGGVNYTLSFTTDIQNGYITLQ